MSSPSQLVARGAIQGDSFLAIEAAIPVVQNRHLDISKCKLEVFRKDSSLVSLFIPKTEAGETSRVGVRGGVELGDGEIASISEGADWKLVDTIPGGLIPAIQTAEKVFQQKQAHDLTEYRINIVGEQSSVTVIFTDKNARPRGRGNPGALPAFEVELKTNDLRVLRSNFVR